MAIRKQLIALYTLVRRELVRMFRIASQVFLPPVITTTLYFLIFGSLIGPRIGNIEGELPHVHCSRTNYDVSDCEFLWQCLFLII